MYNFERTAHVHIYTLCITQYVNIERSTQPPYGYLYSSTPIVHIRTSSLNEAHKKRNFNDPKMIYGT